MTFKKVVVVGGGVLGSQIAFQAAYCGFDVTVLLRSEGSIERAKVKIDKLKFLYLSSMDQMKVDKSAYCKGFTNATELTEEQIEELKSHVVKGYESIKLSTDYEESCHEADLVIESIAEDPKQKNEIYNKISEYLPEKTIIVTNSSTLLPSQLADATGRPEKFLAFHFANYIWKNNTVEIMVHDRTNVDYLDTIANFAEQINMVPLKILKEQRGYILNSLLIPLLNAAETLLVNGVADVETIDKTWRLATGSSQGPFQILDIVGLTTAYNIKSLAINVPNPNPTDVKIAKLLKSKIDAGKTGIASGEGFYKY